MDAPNVSIIVPFHNSEKYLVKCIESVLSQDYEDIELILVNDGSQDGSREICEFYKNTDNRVVLKNQKKMGQSAARNVGIKISRGKYIQFLDSDDYLQPYATRKLVNEINGFDVVISAYRIVSIFRKSNQFEVIKFEDKDVCLNRDEFLSVAGGIIQSNLFHYVWNKLYKKEIIQENIRFEENMAIGEDMIFNIEYFKKANSVKIINEFICNHILYNDNSVTKKYNNEIFNTRKIIDYKTREFLIENGNYSGENKKILDKLLARKVINYFCLLCNPANKIKRKEKSEKIISVINDPIVKNVMYCLDNNEEFNKYDRYSIRSHNSNLIYCYFTLREIAKKYFGGIICLMKK
jgi:glycosyltransferase involved in cell wall biosynthesis